MVERRRRWNPEGMFHGGPPSRDDSAPSPGRRVNAHGPPHVNTNVEIFHSKLHPSFHPHTHTHAQDTTINERPTLSNEQSKRTNNQTKDSSRHKTGMEDSGHAASPGPLPLQTMSPERANQLRDSALRDSSVHDKISQFNSLATQSRQLERRTADAALKRAMLGREEAESDMRRYRDEVRALRRQVDEGRERERRVGERLETVMVRYFQ